ncbi:C1 family peptidase [Xanthomonas perforans]|uniref:C1 family peptidase n=1 Tax=Xanthomonas TaxID=338 RepID=UPI0035C92904
MPLRTFGETLFSGISAKAIRQGKIDARNCQPWPVRNQYFRGTCVAFAIAALRESLICELKGGTADLSEQFLYWATKVKVGDPWPTDDGTTLKFALAALQQYGICQEAECIYNPDEVINDPGQSMPPHAPTSVSIASASSFSMSASSYSSLSPGVTALIDALRKGRPLAVSLPVFSDPLAGPSSNNWNSPTGILYGEVLDPPPTSIVTGGHAACLTGFVPDAMEPSGGYFIIRNSWGVDWGCDLPSVTWHGPEAGYGQISATYVDQFLWEWAQL